MESEGISENFSDLTGNVKKYIQLRLNLLKLKLTEKISRVVTFLLISLIFLILFLFLLIFLSMAFIFWFKEYIGSAYVGALIVSGVVSILILIIYLLRVKLFIDPLVAELSKVIMDGAEENEEDKE